MGGAFAKCLGPPPLPASASRAARAIAGGDRQRAIFAWIDWHAENARLMAKLRHAAAALANMPLKKGISQWHHVWEEDREKKRKLMEACKGIINAKARKAYQSWAETCAAVNAKKAKMAAALAAFTPEGRAKKAAFRQIAWIRKRMLAMQRAANGFRLAGCRAFLQKLHVQLEFLRNLRKAASSIFRRKERLCWNVWSAMAASAHSRKEKMAAAAMKLTPEGRMMTAGFQGFLEVYETALIMRGAAQGFLMGSRKKAMSAWIEATFAVSLSSSSGGLWQRQ